jgi:tRNA threonylcarbamoyladenosine biosynthesis protein TsaB
LNLLLINSNIEDSFAALYSDNELLISRTADYIKNSDGFGTPRSPDRLIQCLSEISQKWEEKHTSLNELDAISVITGPGSFTGIRVGLAIAKGAADALDKKIIPIDNFELTLNRLNGIDPEKKYCILIPAKLPEYYFSIRKNNIEISSGFGELSSLSSLIDKETSVVGNFSDESELFLNYFELLNVKGLKPELDSMLELSIKHYGAGKLYSPENVVPLYIKDFIAKRKN